MGSLGLRIKEGVKVVRVKPKIGSPKLKVKKS